MIPRVVPRGDRELELIREWINNHFRREDRVVLWPGK